MTEVIFEYIHSENSEMKAEIHKNKEKIQQMTKKDELKTALLKQLMQKK
jgi:hypothetical protein